jgi:hypothetical protein
MFVGSQGCFSTDLDFTGIEEHDLFLRSSAGKKARDSLTLLYSARAFPSAGIPYALSQGTVRH